MTRITINGQGYGTGDNGGSVTIDRTFPGVLSEAMYEHEWTSFCDKVDEALAPAGQLREKILGFGQWYLLIISAMFTITSVSFFLDLNIVPVFVYLIVGGVLALMCVCGSYMHIRSVIKKLQEVKKKVEQVCEEESRKRSNVSFHFRVSEKMLQRNHLVFFLIANRSIPQFINLTIAYAHIIWYDRNS